MPVPNFMNKFDDYIGIGNLVSLPHDGTFIGLVVDAAVSHGNGLPYSCRVRWLEDGEFESRWISIDCIKKIS